MTDSNYNAARTQQLASPTAYVESPPYKRDHAGLPYMDPEVVVQSQKRASDFPDLASRAEHPEQMPLF